MAQITTNIHKLTSNRRQKEEVAIPLSASFPNPVVLFVVLLVLQPLMTTCVLSVHDEHREKEQPMMTMLEKYIAPPFMITGKPTMVECGMYVNTFDSINIESMDYSVQIFMMQNWTDFRLRFDESLKNYSHINLDPRLIKDIWYPDLIFVNEKEARYHDIMVPNQMLRIYPDGQITYSVRVSLRLGCQMKLHKFPLDTQTCEIRIESYSFTIDELKLRWRSNHPIEVNADIHLPQFRISKWRTKQCVSKYLTGKPGEYPCLKVEFTLFRVFDAYLVQTYVPSFLIVVVSWVSFWINIDAVPARISLGVMTVLTMTTQSIGLWMTLPRASYIKAIDMWMAVTVLYVFGAMLEFAVVNTLARKEIRRVTMRARSNHANANYANNNNNSGGEGCKQGCMPPGGAPGEPLMGGSRVPAKPPCQGDRPGPSVLSPFFMAKRLVDEYTYGDWKAWDPNSRQLARKIDKISRFAFPLSFALLMAIYWPVLIYT